jgi:hypothetical protein
MTVLKYSSVIVHPALGGDGPRWQPLNVAVALSVGKAPVWFLAGSNNDCVEQLGPDDIGVCLSAERWLAAGQQQGSLVFDGDAF